MIQLGKSKDINKNVFAVADGVVNVVGNESGKEWKRILIHHGGGIYAYYGHLETLNVIEGQNVKAGDKIGEVELVIDSDRMFYLFYFMVFMSKKDFASAGYDKAVENPLCFFDREMQNEIKGAKWPSEEECSKIIPEGFVFVEKPKEEVEEPRIGIVSAQLNRWPSAFYNVSSCYGYTQKNSKKTFYDGIFIKSDKNSQVFAVADGVVEDVYNKCNAASSSSCGIAVIDSTDYGLFQINDKAWRGHLEKNGFDWEKVKTNPKENIRAAAYIYKNTLKQTNGGFNQWSAFNPKWGNEPYKQYLRKNSKYNKLFLKHFKITALADTARAIMWAESGENPKAVN